MRSHHFIVHLSFYFNKVIFSVRGLLYKIIFIYSCLSTYQSRFVRCLYFLSLDLVPGDIFEEGMIRDLSVGAEGNPEAPSGVLV